jgi:hypothetical protein
MCKNLDSPHPLTPSPNDGRRGTRIMSPLYAVLMSNACCDVLEVLLTIQRDLENLSLNLSPTRRETLNLPP